MARRSASLSFGSSLMISDALTARSIIWSRRFVSAEIDSRSPDRSVASPFDQCSAPGGVPARRIHLNGAWAVQDICGHQCTVFCEC